MKPRVLYSGESHGLALTAIVEGFPAGLRLDLAAVNNELRRRQGGYGRGGRMKIERDEVEFISGVRHGETIGSPITVVVRNRDHDNWSVVMNAWTPRGQPSDDRRLTRPRPGHADLAGGMKYNRRDLRDILERASARETAARVAVGAIAKQLLATLGVRIASHVVRVGRIAINTPTVFDVDEIARKSEESEMRCVDAEATTEMMAEVDRARDGRDTLGGTFEVVVGGVPPGLGSHVTWDRRLDARLAAVVMSVPAVKAVEIGLGVGVAAAFGSAVHDPIVFADGRFQRTRNNAGGIEGGMSNGEPIVVRGALKPISTLPSPLASVDIDTKKPGGAATERSDTCAVPAAAVIGEAVVAWVVAEAVLEKFGGDSLGEFKRNVEGYRAQVAQF
ncbi:MAG: chorismate synthase [Deltaproteobacteria bacterium]|nr:chorismate synthase [Deltaproteobacteria bacterium]